MNSREKGKRGEREFAKAMTELGIPSRRGVQHCGGEDSPDVRCDLPGYHFEVKRTEKLRIWDAVAQAEGDCGANVPVVAHRANGKDWVVVLRLEDFVRLAKP